MKAVLLQIFAAFVAGILVTYFSGRASETASDISSLSAEYQHFQYDAQMAGDLMLNFVEFFQEISGIDITEESLSDLKRRADYDTLLGPYGYFEHFSIDNESDERSVSVDIIGTDIEYFLISEQSGKRVFREPFEVNLILPPGANIDLRNLVPSDIKSTYNLDRSEAFGVYVDRSLVTAPDYRNISNIPFSRQYVEYPFLFFMLSMVGAIAFAIFLGGVVMNLSPGGRLWFAKAGVSPRDIAIYLKMIEDLENEEPEKMAKAKRILKKFQ